MKRLAPFVLGIAVGGVLGFLVGSSRPKASVPRAAAPGRAEDDDAQRVAELTEELVRARSENDELRAAMDSESEDRTPARAEPTVATEKPTSTGTLRVKALRADGDPLPGATVIVRQRGPKSTEERRSETDAEGTAPFPNLTPGRWSVFVSKAAGSCEGDVDVRAGETADMAVSFTEGTAVIEGTVRSRDSGPFADTSVNASIRRDGATRHFSTRTDAEGRYRLEKLPAGKCLVSASVKIEGKFKTMMEWIELTDGAVVHKDFEHGVREAGTGRPIADASVRTQTPMYDSTKSDDRGQWQLLNLMPGDYGVSVSKDGYGIEFVRGIEVGGPARRLDLELRPAAELVLIVTGPDGRPYQGRLIVSFRPTVEGVGTRVGTSVTTDESGRAVYRQVLPGGYDILFRAESVGAAMRQGVKLTDGTNELKVKLR